LPPINYAAVKCDCCANPATIHEVTIHSGKRMERHLCENCARAQGVVVQSQPPVTQVIADLLKGHAITPPWVGPDDPAANPAAANPAPGACAACGLKFAEFRQGGLLGCPRCYMSFAEALAPLLERYHQGATHHVGKVPRRFAARIASLTRPLMQEGGPPGESADEARGRARLVAAIAAEREARITELRKQLDAAVAAEDYRRAALLRDELLRVTSEAREAGGGTPIGGGGPSA